MSYKNIPFGGVEKFNVLVETPKGSAHKYEYSEKLDAIVLDFIYTGGFCFPYNYGFIPETLGGDGDNLDAFVLTANPILPGVIVPCRAIGIIELLDRGEEDNKIICVPVTDRDYKSCENLSELSFDYKTIFENFFKEVVVQKNKIIEIKGFFDKARAIEAITEATKSFLV